MGRPYIYNVIDWNYPGTALLNTAAIMVLGIFLHIFTFIVQKLRYRLHKKFFQRETFVISVIDASNTPV